MATRTWVDGAAGGTPINANNLNGIETDLTTALGVPDAALKARIADQTSQTAAQLNTLYASKSETLDYINAAHAAGFPMAMGTPPALAVSGPGGASPIPTPTLLAYDTALVTKIGCVPVLRTQFSTNYYTNSVNGNWTAPPWAVEFTTDATTFAMRFRPENTATSFYITVDGYPVSRTPYNPPALSSGSLYYLQLTFKTSAPRTIRIHMLLADFGGLDMPGTATTTATTPVGKKVLILGDSWTEGTSQAPYPDVYSNVTARTLSWLPYICGQGGTGYTTAGAGGGREVFGGTARLNSVAQAAPDYIIVSGCQNDDGAAGIQAAAASMYSALNTSLPATKLIIVGPQSSGTPSNNRLTNRDAVKAAALSAPNVLAFVDPIAQNWITGAGKITARTGTGNADYMIGSDGLHPNVLGAHYYGKRIAQEIVAVFIAAGLSY